MFGRSLYLAAALGLLGVLTASTPSQAGFVNVSEGFSLTESSNSVTSITFAFTNSEFAGGKLDGLSIASFTGVAVNLPAGLVPASVSSNAALGTLTLSFSTPVELVSGSISFDTTTTTTDVTLLQSAITQASVTVVSPSATQTLITDPLHFTVLTPAVPEPASMGMVAMGLGGALVVYRRRRRAA
jgi:hypothetical protein